MDISCVFFGIMFTVSGILFALGKLHVHLSVWKDMPGEEKESINIKRLCLNIGLVIVLCGVIFLIKGFTSILSGKWFVVSMIAWLVLSGFDVWHISKSSLYQNK